MNIFEKIRALSETKRKIILWTIIVIIGLSLLFFWVKNFQKKMKEFKKEEFLEDITPPPLKESIQDIPRVDFPENNGE